MIALVRLPDVRPVALAWHAAGLGLAEVPHPDAALLTVCAELRQLQAEWQRLWAACPEEGDGKSAADKALDRYTAKVWPGTRRGPRPRPDLVSQLLSLHATTAEGRAAKAAAVVAIEDVYGYAPLDICDRPDACELQMSALRDAAGEARIPLGKDAE